MAFLKQILFHWRRRSHPQTYKPVILVTGCSSGIGLSLARLLWSCQDYRVAITARRSSLEKLELEPFKNNDRFMILALDVTSSNDRQQVVEAIREKWQGVDILINNAGISYRSVVEHMSESDELRQMETNYLGPISLIRLIVPYMRARGRGKIINVSSVSGMLAMPTMSSYSASKHALEGASEALWYEMRPLGINVSLIQPGFVHSNSFERVLYPNLASQALMSDGPYSDYYASMVPFIARMMKLSWVSPEKISERILSVIKTEDPPLWVPVTLDALIFHYLRRFLPRRLLHPILFFLLPGATKWGRHYSRARRLKRFKRSESWVK